MFQSYDTLKNYKTKLKSNSSWHSALQINENTKSYQAIERRF